jgi:hypothetical protein
LVDIWQSNTSPSLTDTIKVNGVAFDLTASTVKLRMRLATAAPTDVLKIDTAATVVSAVAGTVRYDWVAGDVDTAGEYVAWWHVTLPSTKVQDSDEFTIVIAEHGLRSGNLCSLADVRNSLELPDAETTRDNLILGLIPVASQMICQWAEREFAPSSAAGVKRRIEIDSRSLNSRIVDLAPYDLQTATLVQLSPESSSPTTLTAGTDYELTPTVQPADEPVYTSLRLSNYLNIVPTNLLRFNFAYMDITGTWGFPSVPAVVSEACSDAVSAWCRRDVSSLGLQLQDGMTLAPEFIASYDLPISAIRKIQNYRRHAGAF